jgi:hypothetical protein
MNEYSNIEDYLVWRGDLTFEQSPFSLIDSLIFCELSYVDFKPARIKETAIESMTLREAGHKILNSGKYALKNLYGGQENFFRLAIESRRFGDLWIHDYKDVFSASNEVQFAAITFDLDEHTSYAAFRGTDDSITGWKEDFMISFTRIESQALASAYLNETFDESRKYYIGGHSKGGNLALYAMAHLSLPRREKVLRVYDLDGPGFAPDVFDLNLLEPFQDKITKVSPAFCIIGRVYDLPFEDVHIISSSYKRINQHDLISWKIHGLKIQEEKKYEAASTWLIQVLMEWAQSASIEERKIFVDEFFHALEAGGTSSIMEINGTRLIRVLKAMSQTSDTAKRIGAALAKTAIGIE